MAFSLAFGAARSTDIFSVCALAVGSLRRHAKDLISSASRLPVLLMRETPMTSNLCRLARSAATVKTGSSCCSPVLPMSLVASLTFRLTVTAGGESHLCVPRSRSPSKCPVQSSQDSSNYLALQMIFVLVLSG